MTHIHHPLSLTIILLSYACCLPSLAAVSPLATADAYTFTRPAVTNAVKGLVMGDAGDYGVMRYEDIAWLDEAAMERRYLSSRNGSSPQSITNDLDNVRTNTAQNLYQIGSHNTVLPISHMIAPECELSEQIRVMRHANGTDNTTNQYVVWHWSLATNRYSFATNFITQVMTNGQVNVFTNMVWYNPTFTSNNIPEQVTSSTNRIETADFCTVSNLITFAEDKEFVRHRMLTEEYSIRGPYARAPVTNLYGIIRRMNRTVPIEASASVSATNATYVSYSRHNGVESPPYTYKTSYTSYSVDVYGSETYLDRQYKDGDNWEHDDDYPKEDSQMSRHTTIPDNLDMVLRVGSIADHVVMRNAGTPRVKSAQAFALMSCQDRYVRYASHSISTGSGTAVDIETNGWWRGEVMVPIGTATRRSSASGYLELELTVDTAVYSQAANACGVPFLGAAAEPDMPSAGTPDWSNTTETERYKETSVHSSDDLVVSIEDIFVVLNLSPSTKLSTWSEYE